MLSKCVRTMALAGIAMILTTPLWAQGRANQRAGTRQNCLLNALPAQDLDAGEAAGLIKMREEEKLARDVYTKFYTKWSSRVFYNISASEQRHMDAIGRLLQRYGLADPAEDKAPGVFQNADFQALYLELTAQGEKSLAEAFRVAASIEEMDIQDLRDAIASTDNGDLLMVYGNLLRGSLNHLGTFVAHLETLGESYSPRYISEGELATIMSTKSASGAAVAGSGRGARKRIQ